jgi:hypothetical protein
LWRTVGSRRRSRSRARTGRSTCQTTTSWLRLDRSSHVDHKTMKCTRRSQDSRAAILSKIH